MAVVADYFVAELSKLVRRPANWVLCSILVLNIVLFGYVFLYAYLVDVQGSGASSEAVAPLLARLLPENALLSAVTNLAGTGGALALVFGVLLSGGEYGWGTLKLVLSQRPGRSEVLLGKVLAVATALAALSLGVLAMCLLCSLLVAVAQGAAANPPSVGRTLEGLGIGWLIMFAWASLGVLLGILFRGTPVAIGVGLVYMLVVERLALRLPVQGEAFDGLRRALLSDNASQLVGALRGDAEGGAPLRAALMLAAYSVVFLAAAAAIFRRRDV